MKLRFQTPDPTGARNAVLHLSPHEYNLLGLPERLKHVEERFSFPTLDDKAIWLDVEIDHYFYAAWLLWAEHARLCGLITGVEIVPESEKGGEA